MLENRSSIRAFRLKLKGGKVDPNEIREKLRSFLQVELIGRPDYSLPDDAPLITGGLMDSFSLVQVGVFIESEFGVYIPDTDLTVANMNTIDQIVARILASNDR